MSDYELESLDTFNIIESAIDDSLKLSKYDLKIVKKANESFIKKVAKQVGKNTLSIAKDFLLHGPGMSNFNMFRGVGELVIEDLKEDFIIKIGNIYDKDFRFRKFYDTVLNRFAQIKENSNIDEQLYKIAKSILNTSTNSAQGYTIITTEKEVTSPARKEDINLFKASLNLVSLLMDDRYTKIIKPELASFYGTSRSILIKRQLDDLVKRLNTVDPNNVSKSAAKVYVEYYESNKQNNAITSLFYMVSNALSCVKYRVGNKVDEDTDSKDIIIINPKTPVVKVKGAKKNYNINFKGSTAKNLWNYVTNDKINNKFLHERHFKKDKKFNNIIYELMNIFENVNNNKEIKVSRIELTEAIQYIEKIGSEDSYYKFNPSDFQGITVA